MQDERSNIRERHYDVDQNFDGWRLDKFIADRIPRLSRSRAGEIAKFGDVRVVPDRKIKAGTKLRTGDVVVIREHLPCETYDDDRIKILYEDSAILVLNKPSGVLVHEAASVRLNTIQAFLHRAGFSTAEPAHRLDRETSGVLLCGKDKPAVVSLRKMFAEAHPIKLYRALVLDPGLRWGTDWESIEIPLGLDPGSDLGIRMGRGDLASRTIVRSLRTQLGLNDLEVRIETGRQHQIRAHLSLSGTPVAGDKLYTYDDLFFAAITDNPDDVNLKRKLTFERHALHAWRITFPHPEHGDELSVEAPLPGMWTT